VKINFMASDEGLDHDPFNGGAIHSTRPMRRDVFLNPSKVIIERIRRTNTVMDGWQA